MASTLPRFARGLKLARLGVFVMLAQLVLGIGVALMALSGSDRLLAWSSYLLLATLGATVAIGAGSAMAIGELRRARIAARGLVVATIAFAVAAAMLVWSYQVLSGFRDLFDRFLEGDEVSLDTLAAAAEDLGRFRYTVILRDLGYSVGLIALLGTVERSAAISDQLALRDDAGHIRRGAVVLLVADLFYQLTYGLGAGATGVPLGIIASLFVAAYWIYFHARLFRFLENAAYFVNEPHDLPVMTVVKVPEPGERPPAARPPAAPRAPSAPSTRSATAPVIAVLPTHAPAPARAASVAEAEAGPDGGPSGGPGGGDGPKLLT